MHLMFSMNSTMLSAAFSGIIFVVIVRCDYFPIQNAEDGEFGLKNHYGAPCLLLRFTAQLYNLNLNGTNIATEVPDLTSPKVKLSGHCAFNNSKKSTVLFQANWKKEGRKKQIVMHFGTAYVKTLVSQLEELRWQLQAVSYSESYSGQTVDFSSNDVVMSAPLKQKFICRDKLNITLVNQHFKDYILELRPEIDAQPYYVVSGAHPSLYICERTRRRTLAESFESRMTIVSGVILCISSVSVMVGYSFRRHQHPIRRQFYESLS